MSQAQENIGCQAASNHTMLAIYFVVVAVLVVLNQQNTVSRATKGWQRPPPCFFWASAVSESKEL